MGENDRRHQFVTSGLYELPSGRSEAGARRAGALRRPFSAAGA